MKVNDLEFKLPHGLIAQYPKKKRDQCKLLIYLQEKDKLLHTSFKHIIDHINKDDILIFKNTKVFPARLHGYKKRKGAKNEKFMLKKKRKK